MNRVFLMISLSLLSCRFNNKNANLLSHSNDLAYAKQIRAIFSGNFRNNLKKELEIPGINRIHTAKNLYLNRSDKVKLTVTCQDYKVQKNRGTEKITSALPGQALPPFELNFSVAVPSETAPWDVCQPSENRFPHDIFRPETYASKPAFQNQVNRFNLVLNADSHLVSAIKQIVTQRPYGSDSDNYQPYCRVTKIDISFGRCGRMLQRKRTFVPRVLGENDSRPSMPGVKPFPTLSPSRLSEMLDGLGADVVVTSLTESIHGIAHQALGGDRVRPSQIINPPPYRVETHIPFRIGNLYTSSHPVAEAYLNLRKLLGDVTALENRMKRDIERRTKQEIGIIEIDELDKKGKQLREEIAQVRRMIPLSDETLVKDWDRKYNKWMEDTLAYGPKLYEKLKTFPNIFYLHGTKEPHPAGFASFLSALAQNPRYAAILRLSHQEWHEEKALPIPMINRGEEMLFPKKHQKIE